MRSHLRSTVRVAVIALALLATAGAASAQGRGGWHGGGGWHHGGHHHGGSGWVWGGVGLGLGLGLASAYASPAYAYYPEPRYVVVNPPIYDAPQVVYSQPVPARTAQQPVIYPRNGQSAATMDADANACSEWAGKQPNATADASVFQRGISACMDARGYTLR
jgi:hypothetical protein